MIILLLLNPNMPTLNYFLLFFCNKLHSLLMVSEVLSQKNVIRCKL